MKKPAITTMRAQVYQIIKDAICSGQYEPGSWLQEKELASQLCVSRSPVREALRQLSVDGLTVEIPNKGVFVKEITAKDIGDVFAMRVLLENYAIEHLRKPISADDKKQLHKYLNNLETAHRNDDLRLYITLDTELHELIIKLCYNDLLESLYEKVYSMIQQFRIYSLVSKIRFDESVDEHRGLIECILEGKTKEAIGINKRHLKLARDKILEYLETHKKEKAETGYEVPIKKS